MTMTSTCDWCGKPVPDAPAHLEIVTCSQGCHEHRKAALGKHIGMGPGTPHKFVEPANPNRWPGYQERRAAASAQARIAGLKNSARRAVGI
jgi:hypothetical protein